MSGNRNKKKTFIVNFIILQAEEFLIYWGGFSTFKCAWKPKTHIPCHILQDFNVGQTIKYVENIRYMYVSEQFLSAIQQRMFRRTRARANFYLEIPLSTHRQLLHRPHIFFSIKNTNTDFSLYQTPGIGLSTQNMVKEDAFTFQYLSNLSLS